MPTLKAAADLTRSGHDVECRTRTYRFRWEGDADAFTLDDAEGRRIVSGSLQPALTVAVEGSEQALQGRLEDCAVIEPGQLRIGWGTSDGLTTQLSLRFTDETIWMSPVGVTDPLRRPLVQLVMFARVDDAGLLTPTLRCSYLLQPGISASPSMSPVLGATAELTVHSWLGRGSTMDHRKQHGQWGLPVHYLAGASMDRLPTQRLAYPEGLSDRFCLGLADLPSGDLAMWTQRGLHTPVVEYREDLWGAPAETTERGATWVWAFGPDWRSAIGGYYQALVDAGAIQVPQVSAEKARVRVMTQFNTWGAQAATGTQWDRFDGAAMDAMVDQLGDSGLAPELFVVDDKWEGRYGLLSHDEARFPDFERQLDALRDTGMRVGFWAAFIRCEDPTAVGLTTDHVLRNPDGSPYLISGRDGDYYLYDLSQDVVAETVAGLARRFAERYRPDLVKFDFGYELPSLSLAAPHDLGLAGERMLSRGVEVVVGALREVRPDVVVMYYNLSPLLLDYVDLHSVDDLWLSGEEYFWDANRRIFFSGLLGAVNVPSYGSGGYGWDEQPQIWFDSCVAGALGSLGSFVGDAHNDAPGPSPEQVSHWSGLRRLVRAQGPFHVDALKTPRIGLATSGRSSSWARREAAGTVLVALRPVHWDGSRGVTEHGPVSTDVQVVVGSLTDADLATTDRLGVVAFGPGTVSLEGHVPRRVIEHLLTGETIEFEVTLTGGRVAVPVRDKTPDGRLVTWLEIER